MNVQGHNLWHQRLGHPSSDVLRQVSGHTTGGPAQLTIPKDIPICRGCAQGKMTSSSFPDSSSRATEPFALIHSDLKTIPVISYHKYKYVLTFLNDFTSYGWVTFLKDKASTYDAWLNFITMVKVQYKKDVRAAMCNMGGEFTSSKLETKFEELGIKVFHSVPHMPQQNGQAERFNRTIFEKAEAMRHFACLPKSWWEFCVKYAIYAYNRTPMQQIKFKTPSELLNGLKPDLPLM
jgi:GAG-pre-integrase domain